MHSLRVEAPGGVEPPTNGLGNRCSIQLSYGATASSRLHRLQFTTPAFGRGEGTGCTHTAGSHIPRTFHIFRRLPHTVGLFFVVRGAQKAIPARGPVQYCSRKIT